MTWEQLIRRALKQSPFLAFPREDIRRIDERRRSPRYVYVRFAYQWKDTKDRPRRRILTSLKQQLQDVCEEARSSVRGSTHQLNFAKLRGEAGTYLLRRIVVDIMSADLLIFDLTYRNPNVLFELGIAYAMGRRLFLVIREDRKEDIPSDLGGLTVSPYIGAIESFSSSSTLWDIKTAMRDAMRRKVKLRK